MVVDDLNIHLVRGAYEGLLALQRLMNHVQGGLLDQVVMDLDDDVITYSQVGQVGVSHHYVVLTRDDRTLDARKSPDEKSSFGSGLTGVP